MKFQVENGCFSYRKDQPLLLKNISFSTDTGDMLAILGPNGAGKTTLLRCTMGFLRWKQGRTLLDGRDIRGLSTREIWQRLAYVPQARGVVSSSTVEEMVLLGRGSRINLFAQPSAKDKEIAYAALERLNLQRLSKRKCSELSGGELQLTLIARALAAEPRILILDEPESNLDFKNQLLIMETVSSLANQGITCIFNTHYPTHALLRANKALLLSATGDYKFGSAEEVITEENIRQAFGVKAIIGQIETPYQVVKDVIPLSLSSEQESSSPENQNRQCLATVSIIANSNQMADRINELLHEYRDYLIGRLGMPYPPGNVFLITVNMDAPEKDINSLTAALGRLPGVSVKTTFAREQDNRG